MNRESEQGDFAIIMTFAVAIMLTMLPLPQWLSYARPEWCALVLIYWCLALPQRIGIAVAWVVGLVLDVVHGTLLGQYALAYAIIAYFTLYGYQRMRIYQRWQQAIVIFVLTLLILVIRFWVDGISGHPPNHWYFWTPIVTTALLWPFSYNILRWIRHSYGVQ